MKCFILFLFFLSTSSKSGVYFWNLVWTFHFGLATFQVQGPHVASGYCIGQHRYRALKTIPWVRWEATGSFGAQEHYLSALGFHSSCDERIFLRQGVGWAPGQSRETRNPGSWQHVVTMAWTVVGTVVVVRTGWILHTVRRWNCLVFLIWYVSARGVTEVPRFLAWATGRLSCFQRDEEDWGWGTALRGTCGFG